MKNLPILALVAVFVVLGCKSAQTTAPVAVAPAAPPLAVLADDIIRDYKANEVAADAKYKGKRLAVAGLVEGVSETFGVLQGSLKMSKSDSEVVTVNCSFSESQRDQVAKLSKGKPAAFIGECDGMTAGLYVGLSNCTLQLP